MSKEIDHNDMTVIDIYPKRAHTFFVLEAFFIFFPSRLLPVWADLGISLLAVFGVIFIIMVFLEDRNIRDKYRENKYTDLISRYNGRSGLVERLDFDPEPVDCCKYIVHRVYESRFIEYASDHDRVLFKMSARKRAMDDYKKARRQSFWQKFTYDDKKTIIYYLLAIVLLIIVPIAVVFGISEYDNYQFKHKIKLTANESLCINTSL